MKAIVINVVSGMPLTETALCAESRVLSGHEELSLALGGFTTKPPRVIVGVANFIYERQFICL
jgi:hypothetical protein